MNGFCLNIQKRSPSIQSRRQRTKGWERLKRWAQRKYISKKGKDAQKEYYAVRIVVEHNSSSKQYDLVEYGVVGQLHAANTKKIPLIKGRQTGQKTGKPSLTGGSTYNIAQLLKDKEGGFCIKKATCCCKSL